jgi:drug/metabolite transporter (DMT)-like permease
MFGIVAAVYSSFFLALSQGALKKSFREFEPSVAFMFDALFGLLIWIPVAFYFGVNFANFEQVIVYALISAVLSEALYFYALSKGQLSITSVLLASYPIYTILFSYFINSERLTSVQATFVAITILGTLMTYLPSKLSFDELKKSGALFWPIIAAVGIGLSDTLSKGIINKTGDYSFLFALALMQIPIAALYLRVEKTSFANSIKMRIGELHQYKLALIGSFFSIIGTGLLWISFSNTLASIASPITATSGAIVVLLAMIFMDESIDFKSIIGLILVFVGIMGISVVSV